MKPADIKKEPNRAGPGTPRWVRSKKEMTEEEIEKIRSMNWEWYYNCFLYLDEPLEIICKVCGGLNNFLPREMSKKCLHCGIECHRCEKTGEDSKTFQP